MLQFIFELQNDKKREKGRKKQKQKGGKDIPLTKADKNWVSVLSRIMRYKYCGNTIEGTSSLNSHASSSELFKASRECTNTLRRFTSTCIFLLFI